jgi:NAD+ kinase
MEPGWRAGVVVHPARNVEVPLRAFRDWAARRGVDVVQIPVPGQDRDVAESGQAGDCDLILSIGGDGTTLAAIRAAVAADRPVLGVACGSLGVLTTVDADAVAAALDRFAAGDWRPRTLPALTATHETGEQTFAINDMVIVRAGPGQLRSTASIDGNVFARLAGDGLIVSTPVGSSAYALAAGGPLLAPQTQAYLLTPLPTHGGTCPSLVIAAGSELELEFSAGFGGARLEIDGQVADSDVGPMTIRLRPAVAKLVTFADHEPFLDGLRRRGIITDSPRIRVEDNRDAGC